MTTIKTKIEIINETVEYYSTNPRSLNGTSCRYLSNTGAMCAFSRCCTPKGVEILSKTNEGKGVYELPKLNTLLSPEYHGYDREFWECMQDLHDSEEYWIYGEGLSDNGRKRVKDLIEKYSD